MTHEYNVCSEKPLQLGEVIDGWCIYFAYGGVLAVARAINPLQDYQYAVFDTTELERNHYHITVFNNRNEAEKNVIDSIDY